MFDLPKPQTIAPNLTMEQRASMQPLDLMAQYIVPKLLDKINLLEWQMKKLEHDLLNKPVQSESNKPIQSEPVEKPKRRRKKAAEVQVDSEPRSIGVEANIKEPVRIVRIADYNPETDKWEPKVINGVTINSFVVQGIMGNLGYDFPTSVVGFVMDLTSDERDALCDAFPSEDA